ncbi:MFS transporter [Nocardiopsis halophila]|uniref:MFS transporter n=1 Tax=Nocardiopsis halophila TaxID=141692 RepID=UPI00034A9352|nr:MFS transporter [Nocardiopsis halophila]
MQSTPAPRAALLTLLVTSLGSFMVLLDGSIIFVALPEIQHDLDARISDLQWTVDGYTLPFAALMLTAGTVGDRFGRKRAFLVGLVLFLAGSAVCGFAPGAAWLVAGRVVQGLGAAAINTGSLALLVSTFTDPAGRAKAIGIWTAVSGVSLALGPLVGGVLIEAFSWQAIFLVNLPIGALALLLGVPGLAESRNPQASHLDIRGQVLVVGGLFCLVMGLIQGEGAGWGSPVILSLLIGAALLLAAFLVVEKRGREPLLPLDLFRDRTFSAACTVAALLGFVIVGAMFFMAQYFQSVQDRSALDAGLRLLPLTLGIFLFSPPASRIAGRIGPRAPVIAGAVAVTAGFLLLTAIEPASAYGAVWWRLALVGAGIGCMFAPLTLAVMSSTPPQRAGLGSSMINTMRITGFTAGAAVLGTIVLTGFKDRIAEALAALGVPADAGQGIAEQVGGAGALAGRGDQGTADLPVSGERFAAAVDASFVGSIHVVFLVCAGCTVAAALITAVFMKRGRPEAPAAPPPGARAEAENG